MSLCSKCAHTCTQWDPCPCCRVVSTIPSTGAVSFPYRCQFCGGMVYFECPHVCITVKKP